MPEIDILNVPPHIPRCSLEHKVTFLKKMVFCSSEHQLRLTYLGGITNHGLKDDERKLFVRIPGHHSEILIDRTAELDTLTKLTNWSSSHLPLLEGSPLRTERATFTALRSSSHKAE